MKLFYAVFGVLAIWSVLIFCANAGGRANTNNAANTGAPCEGGQTCSSCHVSAAYAPVNEEFKLIDPSLGQEIFIYALGKVYNAEIKVNATGFPSEYGFQATAIDTNNQDAGKWLNPSNIVQISEAEVFCGTGSRTYIEHSAPFFLSTFKIDWQAPTCDIGPITFYFIGNAVNNDNSSSGDTPGPGSNKTYNAQYPQNLVIDSSNIPPGVYLASAYVKMTGNLTDNNIASIGALDSLLFHPPFEVKKGSQLSAFNDNCLE